jgi:hypothetical protein
MLRVSEHSFDHDEAEGREKVVSLDEDKDEEEETSVSGSSQRRQA